MSLPVAHVLVGCGISLLLSPRLDARMKTRARLMTVVLTVMPDFDFAFVWILGLPSEVWHRTFSHSITFVAAIGGLTYLIAPLGGLYRRRAALFAAALVGSHLLVDLIGIDDSGSPGMMLLWPVSDGFYHLASVLPSGLQPRLPDYAWVVFVEALFGGAVVLAAWLGRRAVSRRAA